MKKTDGLTPSTSSPDDSLPVEPRAADEPVMNLFEFLRNSPLAKAIAEDGIDFEIERSRDLGRDIDLD